MLKNKKFMTITGATISLSLLTAVYFNGSYDDYSDAELESSLGHQYDYDEDRYDVDDDGSRDGSGDGSADGGGSDVNLPPTQSPETNSHRACRGIMDESETDGKKRVYYLIEAFNSADPNRPIANNSAMLAGSGNPLRSGGYQCAHSFNEYKLTAATNRTLNQYNPNIFEIGPNNTLIPTAINNNLNPAFSAWEDIVLNYSLTGLNSSYFNGVLSLQNQGADAMMRDPLYQLVDGVDIFAPRNDKEYCCIEKSVFEKINRSINAINQARGRTYAPIYFTPSSVPAQ